MKILNSAVSFYPYFIMTLILLPHLTSGVVDVLAQSQVNLDELLPTNYDVAQALSPMQIEFEGELERPVEGVVKKGYRLVAGDGKVYVFNVAIGLIENDQDKESRRKQILEDIELQSEFYGSGPEREATYERIDMGEISFLKRSIWVGKERSWRAEAPDTDVLEGYTIRFIQGYCDVWCNFGIKELQVHESNQVTQYYSGLLQIASSIVVKISANDEVEDGVQASGNQPMKISVICDKADNIYESGERVELTVRVEKLVDYEYDENTYTYRGGTYELASDAKFLINFTFPGGVNTKTLTLQAVDGEYTFSPFAPYETGEYVIQVRINPRKNNFPAGEGIINKTTFTTIEPMENSQRYIPDQSQINKIIKLFKESKDVPPNWEKVLEKRGSSSKPLNDMEYGAYNNAYFCKKKSTFQMSLNDPIKTVTVSNGYNCPAYTCKTLRFLTKLRFGIGYDDSERKLLRGLDYGPIVRAGGLVTQIFGEHQAVVLYDYWFKEDWAFYSSAGKLHAVLDPWPKQRAENFTLTDFCYFYARLYPPYEGIFMNPYGNPEWKAGSPEENAFPLFNGAVYWNLEMKELKIKYVIPPETGTPEGEPFDPPQKEEQQKEKSFKPPLSNINQPIHDYTGRIVTYECPVILDISDDKGQHLGIVNGKLVSDIERSQLLVNQKSETDFFWYVWLPEGRYNVNIIGIADGSFETYTTKGDILQYYNASIRKDEVATIKLDPDESVEEVLILSNGDKISPTEIIIEQNGGNKHDGGGIGILVAGAISLIIILIIVLMAIKRRRSSAQSSASVEKSGKHIRSGIRKSTEQTISCPACGKINPSSTNYCINCGKAIEQTSFCEECGRKIPSGSTYCTHCGDKQGVA